MLYVNNVMLNQSAENGVRQNRQNHFMSVLSDDSDQPWQLSSLIGVITGHKIILMGLSSDFPVNFC